MKKTLILLLVFTMFGCSSNETVNETVNESPRVESILKHNLKNATGAVHMVEIDDCEYIIATHGNSGGGGISIIHKENCKFCEERNKLKIK